MPWLLGPMAKQFTFKMLNVASELASAYFTVPHLKNKKFQKFPTVDTPRS